MRYKKVFIASIGYELPPYILTSEDIESRLAPLYEALHINKGQLEALTGVRERRLWDREQTLRQGAVAAARKAIGETGVVVEDIGMLVYAGVCRDNMEPAMACSVADGLGLSGRAVIYDVSNACLGVINGMIQVADAIELGQIKAGLVVSCEASRDIIDISIDRLLKRRDMAAFKEMVATLTGGSGAVAVLLTDASLTRQGHALLGGAARSAAEYHELCIWGPDRRMPEATCSTNVMATDSVGVLKNGVRLGIETFADFKQVLGVATEDIDKVICHQVGASHRKTILDALNIPQDKDFPTFPFLGNIGTVSLPITAAIAAERDFLETGDLVGFLGIGSGLNCIMLGIKWNAGADPVCRDAAESASESGHSGKLRAVDSVDHGKGKTGEQDQGENGLLLDTERFPVLNSHVLGGKPVLPFAVMMELLAGHVPVREDMPISGFDDIRVLKGLKLDDDPLRLSVTVKPDTSGDDRRVYAMTLESEDAGGNLCAHASARIATGRPEPVPEQADAEPVSGGKPFPYTVTEVYDKILFHGPLLQGLEEIYAFSSRGIAAQVRSAPLPDSWMKKPLRKHWTADPLVLDAAFQLASIWCYVEKGMVSLPSFVKHYRQCQPAYPRKGTRVVLTVRETTRNKLTGDFHFYDGGGNLIAWLTGYEAVMDPSLYKAFKPHFAD